MVAVECYIFSYFVIHHHMGYMKSASKSSNLMNRLRVKRDVSLILIPVCVVLIAILIPFNSIPSFILFPFLYSLRCIHTLI